MAEQETNVIVAIPSKDDYVWKTSTEKIPHMTILYLEDLSTDPDLELILEFLQHAVDTSLTRFGLSVNHRGVLGQDQADVVFFEGWDLKKVTRFRDNLLQQPNIKTAYDAVPQFPKWNPHLTLGYPTAPAHPDPRDYPGIHYVQFDKIALWTKDFDGPEFELKDLFDTLEVSMSDRINDILAHHGVKGMKWGVRKDGSVSSTITRTSPVRRSAQDVTAKQKPGKFVRTSGGKRNIASEDAVRVAAARQLAKKSTTDALTNKQLQDAVQRMNLEQQYSTLVKKSDRRTRGQRFVQKLMGGGHKANKNDGSATSQATKQVAAALARKAAAAAAAA